MKRLIPFLLGVVLLTGCTAQKQPQSPSEATEPIRIGAAYSQNNSVEEATNKAVSVYTLTGSVESVNVIDRGVVLSDAQGRLGLLVESDAFITSSELDGCLLVDARDKQLICYNATDRSVLITDDALKVTARFKLEEGISGIPIYGAESNELYYCMQDYIRALDLKTGLTRHVVQHTAESQVEISSHFDGAVIGRMDSQKTTYFSSTDGQNVFVESALRDFATGTRNYYGIYRDGFVDQYIWGEVEGEPRQLLISDEETVYPQMDADCVVTVQSLDSNITVKRYDMSSGLCVGTVSYKCFGNVIDIDSDNQYTWILTDKMLYRWDWAASATKDNTDYTIPLINADNPDTAGIEECKNIAKTLGLSYGVEVLVWDDALLNDDTYNVLGEYQVEVIRTMLAELEKQLPLMPEQIFVPTDEYCSVQICLVRSIDELDFVQFWTDAGLCIAITPNADIYEALITGLGWGIDSRVIGNSRDFDYWDDLNPDGFTYDYSYFVNAHRNDLQYLEGEDRAFTDQRAMSFPSEDRARIFYYALMENNAEMFSSDTMQQKLKTFCEGVREAYGWQKEAQDYPWEQYLNESLAYKK